MSAGVAQPEFDTIAGRANPDNLVRIGQNREAVVAEPEFARRSGRGGSVCPDGLGSGSTSVAVGRSASQNMTAMPA